MCARRCVPLPLCYCCSQTSSSSSSSQRLLLLSFTEQKHDWRFSVRATHGVCQNASGFSQVYPGSSCSCQAQFWCWLSRYACSVPLLASLSLLYLPSLHAFGRWYRLPALPSPPALILGYSVQCSCLGFCYYNKGYTFARSWSFVEDFVTRWVIWSSPFRIMRLNVIIMIFI